MQCSTDNDFIISVREQVPGTSLGASAKCAPIVHILRGRIHRSSRCRCSARISAKTGKIIAGCEAGMKRIALVVAVALGSVAPQLTNAQSAQDVARWQNEAQSVTITRDDWGIAHVRGKTDADAVFGMIYAQAEDDFNRVETNYLNSMGRLAEAEGEGQVYRDLRMKLFIDPADMKAQFQRSPDWLKTLMTAWADGLNYYMYKH